MPGTRTIRVWDPAIRLFHWSLATAVAAAWLTQWTGDVDQHMTIGYVIATLLVWRVLWGLVGSRTARFASFVRGPGAVLRYLKDGTDDRPGHNPLGALSVLAILAVLAAQVGSGLFANDDIFFEGPWAGVVSDDTSDRLTGFHHLNKTILLVLIGLHLLAVAAYHYRGRNLLGPMLTGRTVADADTRQPPERPLWLAAVLLAVAAAATAVLFRYWLL